MALKVVGAGFGRTGTESMKRALEQLGFGPCYHMYEVLPHEDRKALWFDIASGRTTPDWDAIFAGYQAAVDWPAAHYWRELAAHYPEARVVLTYRSAESWYASMSKTILPILEERDETILSHPMITQATFGDDLSRENVIAVYNRHVAEVRATFGPDRLLTYELGSGWAPLCDFLGVPVLDTPYPRGNDAEDFNSRVIEPADPDASSQS